MLYAAGRSVQRFFNSPLDERAVLRLAAEGRGNMEIIDALSLSHGTVHHSA